MFVFRLFVDLMVLNAMFVLIALNTMSVKNLAAILIEGNFIPLICFFSVLIVIDLAFTVSRSVNKGVNKIHLGLIVILAAFLWAGALFVFAAETKPVLLSLKGFTQTPPVLARVLPVIKHGHELNRYTVCILPDMHYCARVDVPKFLFYEPYSVCNLKGNLFYKGLERLNRYDFLLKTYLSGFNVQIFCQRNDNLISMLFSFREKLSLSIKETISQPQSTLLTGIIFGIDQSYDDEFARSIKSAGLSHIVAASGYNVTILTNSVDKVFFFLPFKVKNIISLVLIWIYALITGFASSMVRACTMSSFLILSKMFKFKIDTKDIFKLTFAFLILINPVTVFDIGFQLSIAATFGLIYISPYLEKVKLFKLLSATTFSCILTTLPITIIHFGMITPYSLLANILVLPVIEIAMLLGIVGIVIKPLLFLVWGDLKYVEIVAKIVDSLPFSQIVLNDFVGIMFFVIVVFIILYLLWKNKDERTDISTIG